MCLSYRIAREADDVKANEIAKTDDKKSSSAEELTDKDLDELKVAFEKSGVPKEQSDQLLSVFSKFKKGTSSAEQLQGFVSFGVISQIKFVGIFFGKSSCYEKFYCYLVSFLYFQFEFLALSANAEKELKQLADAAENTQAATAQGDNLAAPATVAA